MDTKQDKQGDVDVSIYLDAPPAYAPKEVDRKVEVIEPAGMATDADDSDSDSDSELLTAEEMLEFLLEIDTGFLVDDSGSMRTFHGELMVDPVTEIAKTVTRWDMVGTAWTSIVIAFLICLYPRLKTPYFPSQRK